MRFSFFCNLLLVGLIACVYTKSTFRETCHSVNKRLSNLDSQITSLRSVADSQRHTDVITACDKARASLYKAQDALSEIAYSEKFWLHPWLVSSSPHKKTCQTHLDDCGHQLKKIYKHFNVINTSAYQSEIQNCKVHYQNCQEGIKTIWGWKSSPTPSGSYSGSYSEEDSDSYNQSTESSFEVSLAAVQNYSESFKMKKTILSDSEVFNKEDRLTKKLKSKSNSRRSRHRRNILQICPLQEIACPISANSDGFECIDPLTELTSCGGCAIQGLGMDCTSIEGADGVGCNYGKCVVLSVQEGYTLDPFGIPKPT